jgi:hypothetical protein
LKNHIGTDNWPQCIASNTDTETALIHHGCM